MKTILACALALGLTILAVRAEPGVNIVTKEYRGIGGVMEGILAKQDLPAAVKKPGVLIVHDWMGLGDFVRDRATVLAKEGYVVFGADVYGKGVRPKDSEEASKLATLYKSDRKLLRARMNAALKELMLDPNVDRKKIVVMGYCFGGTSALELARSGAPLAATVSFHGGLANPSPKDAKNIHGKVLVLHGADDPYVPPTEVNAFQEEMKAAHIPMEFVAYPGAVHAFAVPSAGSDKSKGAAYNAEADHQSWAKLEKLLKTL